VTKGEARKAAEAARAKYDIPAEGRLTEVDKCYIELAGDDPSQPAPVRDILVWRARFRIRNGWRELSVEDATGKIVRVRKSR
jgi:hypothetical protein